MAEIGYCVKCKEKREMQDEEKVTMKNGRPAMKGKCSVCGTGMYKILPKQQYYLLRAKGEETDFLLSHLLKIMNDKGGFYIRLFLFTF